jgi:8-hydroxy-5-deazaflavin:NADPH oxidoreductase
MSQTEHSETIGIIGSGHLGTALARVAVRAGRHVVIANSRGPESLTSVVRTVGGSVVAGKVGDAASCEIVALAVPWSNVRDAVAGLTWSGQILIDATNAIIFPEFRPAPLGGRTSSELVADLVPGARVIKTANSLAAELLGADPREAGGNRVLFLSGDDASAKEHVAAFFDAAGFFMIDLGDLVTGGLYQFAGPLAGLNLVCIPDEPTTGA